jgi:hypothetical protein
LTGVRRGTGVWRVDPGRCPGSVSGVERIPAPGERVYTAEGTAVVVRLLGRTGSGGRLLELAMDDGRKAPFFAAAANVRVPPFAGNPLQPMDRPLS